MNRVILQSKQKQCHESPQHAVKGYNTKWEIIWDWVDRARRQREIEYEPKYGPIRPRTDLRCFRREMIEELLDALNYAQWAKEKGEISRQQWRRVDHTIKVVIHLIEAACSDRLWWRLKAQKRLDEPLHVEIHQRRY